MRRTSLLGVFFALIFGTACHDQVTQPDPDPAVATTNAMTYVAPSNASALSASPLAAFEGHLADARVFELAPDDVINEEDYSCPASTPVIDIFLDAFQQLIDEEFNIVFFLVVNAAADQLPGLEALLFLEEDRKAEYGYDGEFTNQMKSAINNLRRFWDISNDFDVVPMKGTMLRDVDRVVRTYTSPPPFGFGLSEADATFLAQQIQLALDASNLLNDGDHPLFTFNAFAFSGGFGLPPKIVMGDAIMNAYDDLGFGDVAPQAILAHEWAHQIQVQKSYFGDDVPTFEPPVTQAERTRYTELMADAMSAYYLTHSRGGTLRQSRVEQFLEVFFQIGDCAFTNPGHHGTPNQRMAAAQFGFDVADAAQQQGHILTADQFHALFVAEYLNLIAPDAP